MEVDHIPGLMVVLVNRDSVIWQGGLGFSSLDDKSPVSDQTLFRIGSVTKTFVSLGIQKLVAEKKFSLNSKLKDISPEIIFHNPWEAGNPVRVIHLLEHTAGFDDMHFAAMLNRTGRRLTALEELKAHQKSLTSRWKPGTRSSYSNPDYMMLAYLIEKYADMDYQTYIKKEIFDPLQMKSTVFDYEIKSPFATGYHYIDRYLKTLPVKVIGEAAGAISSNAVDMGRYARMYLNNGTLDATQIVDASVIIDMERQHSSIAAAAGLTTGYGMGNQPSMNGGEIKQYFRGHNGGIMGFVADFCYNRDLGVGFVISNNGEESNNKIKDLIADFLTQNNQPPVPVDSAWDNNKNKKWIGTYQLQNPRNELAACFQSIFATTSISMDGKSIYTNDFLGKKSLWVPVKGNLFRKKEEVVPNLVLTELDGAPVVNRYGDFFVKINPVSVWLWRIIVFVALLSGIALVPMSVFWLIKYFRKKMSGVEVLQRSYPTFAFFSLVSSFVVFINLVQIRNIPFAGEVNGRTVFIFIASLAAPVFSTLALGHALVNFKSYKANLRYFLLVSSLAFCAISIYLFSYGWVGIRLWSY